MNRNYKKLKQETQELLARPGVYVMYDSQGQKLYIGKSINIRQRVASYWYKSGERSKKIKRMIHLVETFQVYYTDTELDALLLESEWIAYFKPPYNTVLTKEERPVYFDVYAKPTYALRISRQEQTKAYRRFGPFSNKRLVKTAYAYLTQTYPHFFCGYGQKKLCTNQCPIFQKKCDEPCESYQEGLVEVFEEEVFTKGEMLHKQIEKQINEWSEQWAFEKAGKLYEQLHGLKYLYHTHKKIEEMRQSTYIGCLEVMGSREHKYYLVKQGVVLKTVRGYVSQENRVLESLREYVKIQEGELERRRVQMLQAKQTSNQLLLLAYFKKNKMVLFEV